MAQPPTNGFVPIVLRRILSFVHPADQEICTVTHWQLRRIAAQELHYRLAAPKRGMLLLEWPLCFRTREDVAQRNPHHYINVLRSNVETSQQADENSVVQQVQIFLAGYEALLLSEFNSSVHLYADLTTLAVSIGLKEYDSDLLLPYTKPDSDGSRSRNQPQQQLLMAFRAWAQTMAIIMDHCAETLLHLMLIDAADNARGGENFILPSEFYVALEFDKKLAKMQNLQTLYFPTLGQYERAFNHEKPYSTNAWEALYELPDAERLPSLKRVVFSNDDLFLQWGLPRSNDQRPIRTCGLPVMAARGVLVEISKPIADWILDDLEIPPDVSYLSIIFPEAQIVKKRQWLSPAVPAVKSPKHGGLGKICYYVKEYPTIKLFLETIAQSVEKCITERNASLSVWNHVRSLADRTSQPTNFEINIEVDSNSRVNDTLTSLFNGNASQSIACPYHVIVNFTNKSRDFLNDDDSDADDDDSDEDDANDDDSDEEDDAGNSHGLQGLLPLFTTMRNGFETFADAVHKIKFEVHLLENHNSLDLMLDDMDDENRQAYGGFVPIYQQPKITLCISIELWSGVAFDGDDSMVWFDFKTWARVVEAKMENEIYQLVYDATEAWIAGDDANLKFSMYQKVEQLKYNFSFRPPKRSRTALGKRDSNMFGRFERYFMARQEKFRRRMWSELFAPLAFHTESYSGSELDILGRTVTRIKQSLPLPELKKLQINFRFAEQSPLK